MIKPILISLVCFAMSQAATVHPWSQFMGFVDNREYANTVQIPQTFLGGRLSGGAEFTVGDEQCFVAGIDLLTEYGTRPFVDDLSPVLFYQFRTKISDFYFGMFPRTPFAKYPRALLSDSLTYYRPLIEGTLLELHGNFGFQNIWADWTSRQTDTERETFLTGVSGRLQFGRFFLDHYFVYYHHAGPRVPIPGDHLRDNGGGVAQFGVRATPLFFVDSLIADVGVIGSFDRTRGSGAHTPVGFLGQLTAHVKKFSALLTIYNGENHRLDFGDSFYRASSYGRLDLRFLPILSKYADAQLCLSLHAIEGHIEHQEMFLLTVRFDGLGKDFGAGRQSAPME